jgi:hypothetical protein
MGTEKPFAVWVNGRRYENPDDAAGAVSLLLGFRVPPSWIKGITERGLSLVFDWATVSAVPPKSGGGKPGKTTPAPSRPESAAAMPFREEEREESGPGAGYRYPLLRYVYGENPVDRGVNRAPR